MKKKKKKSTDKGRKTVLEPSLNNFSRSFGPNTLHQMRSQVGHEIRIFTFISYQAQYHWDAREHCQD